MAPVNVVHILRHAHREAHRNAALLDHISATLFSSPSQTPPQPQQHNSPPLQVSNSPPISNPPPTSSSTHSNIQASPQPTPSNLPRNSRPHPPSNPHTNHHHHHHHRATSSAPPRTTSPISKYILSTLFDALHSHHLHNQSRLNPNYVFIDHDQEHDFLYGLVLPVIARLLAVSYPGLMCVVQLPKPDLMPDWAAPSSSDGSKSAGLTTPHDSSRTTPSDEAPIPTKSRSPDTQPVTADLIRRADQILSGADASAEKQSIEKDASSTKNDSAPYPPPNGLNLEQKALPFMCNGFEVLTGKMPPPRYDMRSFTLASVGWEKAAIVSPQNPSKALTMSFSNGMMTPTEGIVVTFSNGSLCLLTTQDPLTMLDTFKINDTTPVVVFLFPQLRLDSLEFILRQEHTTPSPEAAKVRALAERQNFFFAEIGCASEQLPTDIRTECAGEKSFLSKSTSGGSILATKSTSAAPSLSTKSASLGSSLRAKSATSAGSSLGSIIPPLSTDNGANVLRAASTPSRCPPVTIAAVPRAVPLFVNTINQTFIDPPFYDVPENVCENELVNDKYRDGPHESSYRERSAPFSESEGIRASDVNASKRRDVKNCGVSHSESELNYEAENAGVVNSRGHRGVGKRIALTNGGLDASSTAPNMRATGGGKYESVGSPYSSQPRINPHDAMTHGENQNHRLPPMYNFPNYGHGPAYSSSDLLPSVVQTSRQMAAPLADVPRAPPPLNKVHHEYYHSMQSKPQAPNGLPHHTQCGHHSEHPYYAVPMPNGIVHPSAPPSNETPWHHTMQSSAHRAPHLPPPHLVDARRDMPAHFSSHHAVATAQYQQQYYPSPSHHGYLYGTQPETPEMRITSEPRHRTSSSQVTNPSSGSRLEAGNPVPAANGLRKGRKAPGAFHKRASAVLPETDKDRATKPPGTRCDDTQPEKHSSEQNDPQFADKEDALRALIQMRQGFSNDKNPDRQGEEGCGTSSAHTQDGEKDRIIPSKQEISRMSKKRPNESLEAYNNAPEGAEGNACKPSSSNGSLPNGMGESSETSSTASTNSQGAALMQGAATGTSHNPRQEILGPHPESKKSRKR